MSITLNYYFLAIILLTSLWCFGAIDSQILRDPRFSAKYVFPGIVPLVERITLELKLEDMNTTYPHLTMKMNRSTDVKAIDRSCRHFVVRYAPYNDDLMWLERNHVTIPLNYFVKDADLIVTSPMELDGKVTVNTRGFRTMQMANEGMDAYFIDTSLETK